ncbi:unnamed protein product [Diatraea saccharalis]|uniref:Uncharacterized protein n=1 Tax=Diatraea saccharalis TaxID=40085 RepID=A0A9N9R2C8_9NEOP|nr:unnamed protein product [Diatraea saccharalis]
MEQGAMEGAVTPEGERRTRAALAEITARLTNTRDMSTTLPSGYLSPAPSPSELLIRQRGSNKLYMYTNIIKQKNILFCLKGVIFRNTDSIMKILQHHTWVL